MRDLVHDFRVEFWELAPLRDFPDQFARGQKTLGSQLKLLLLLLLFFAFPSAFLLQIKITYEFLRIRRNW